MTPSPADYPPVTAAGLAATVQLLLAAFTDWTTMQVTAVGAAAFLAAAFISTNWTRSKRSLSDGDF